MVIIERIVYALTVLLVVGMFGFFATSNQSNSITPPATARVAGDTSLGPTVNKKMVFNDEFDGVELNAKNWSTCYDWRKASETGCTNGGNFEQQWYTDSQVKLENGQLILTAVKQPVDVAVQSQVKSFDYISGMINSGRGEADRAVRWSGTYGYYEARMLVQKGQGVWPAFWLLPIDKEWPPEIDIMEFIGSKPGEILQTLHWEGDGKPLKSDVIVAEAADYSGDWHTFGVDWRADGIDWYIDGKKTRAYVGPNVPHEPMEIIVNLAIGGLLPGNADASTPASPMLRVDYVRVYQATDQIRPYQR